MTSLKVINEIIEQMKKDISKQSEGLIKEYLKLHLDIYNYIRDAILSDMAEMEQLQISMIMLPIEDKEFKSGYTAGLKDAIIIIGGKDAQNP